MLFPLISPINIIGLLKIEASKAVSDYLKENNKQIVYITVMNALSVDCDCDAHQGDPVMEDIGIIASLDPVANDQAFIDMIRIIFRNLKDIFKLLNLFIYNFLKTKIYINTL